MSCVTHDNPPCERRPPSGRRSPAVIPGPFASEPPRRTGEVDRTQRARIAIGLASRFRAPVRRTMTEDVRAAMLAAAGFLPPTEKAVLIARYGLDGEPESLGELALRFGISRERVRQIENRALHALAPEWQAIA